MLTGTRRTENGYSGKTQPTDSSLECLFSWLQRFMVTGFVLAALHTPVWAAGGQIRAIQYDTSSHRFMIDTTGSVRATVNTVNIASHKRVIIDVDNAEIASSLPGDSQLLQALSRQMSGLRNVTVNQYGGNGRPVVRILLDLEDGSQIVRLIRNQGSRLELEVADSAESKQTASAYTPSYTASSRPGVAASRPTETAPGSSAYQQALQTIERQKREIDVLERQVTRLQTAPEPASPSGPSMDEMKRTLVSMNLQYEKLMQDNRNLKSQLIVAQSRSKLAESEPALAEKQVELDRLKREVQNLRAQLEQKRITPEPDPAVAQLQQTLAALNQKYDALLLENQKLKVEKPSGTTSNPELQNLRQKLTTAQESLNQSIQTINEQNKEIAYLKNRIAEQSAPNQSGEQTMQSGSPDQLTRLQEQVRQLKSELTAAEQKVTQAQSAASRLQASEQQVKTLQGEVARLKAQASKPAVASNTAAKTTAATDAATSALKASVDKLTRENQTLNQTLKTKTADYETIRTKLSQLSRDYEALQTRLTAQSPATDLNVLKDEIARLTQENQELKARQNEVALPQNNGAESEKLQARVTELQNELDALKTRYEKLLADNKQLESKNKVMMAKPAAATGSAALQKQVTALNNQLADLRRENATLRDRVANVKSGPVSANPEAEKNYTEAKASLAAGELEKALEKYKAAQLLEPDNVRYTVDYSVALMQNHDYAEAAELLRRYIGRNPGEREAYSQLGKVYLVNNQAELAAQALSSAIPIGTLNNYAMALKRVGKTEDAEHMLEMALKVNPNDPEVLFNLGNLYNATERLELARNSYLQAIQIKPDFAEAHYNVGLLYSKLGDRNKAITHLERYLQLAPNVKNADTLRAFIEKLKA